MNALAATDDKGRQEDQTPQQDEPPKQEAPRKRSIAELTEALRVAGAKRRHHDERCRGLTVHTGRGLCLESYQARIDIDTALDELLEQA